MSDIKLVQKGAKFDIGFSGADIELTDSLENSVAISLMLDTKAEQRNSEFAHVEHTHGGWWADSIDGYEIGSRLWTLCKNKNSEQTKETARKLCVDALQWMIDDGVAKDVTAEIIGVSKERIDVAITITRPDGTNERTEFQINWESTNYGV